MNKRQSNFELLRVVAILFVVAHHVLLFGADLCGYLTAFQPCGEGIVGVALNSVVVTGVSLFVMITGWFGISRIWQPVLRLVIECAVFGAVALGLCVLLYQLLPIDKADGHFSLMRLWQTMKFTNWWFVTHYLLLILCAPVLERALDGIGQRAIERIVFCMGVFTFVFGFWWGYLNQSGYNVLQFIFLYTLARYFRLYPKAAFCAFVGRYAWAIVVVCATAMTLIFLSDTHCWSPKQAPRVWHYNCPLVVAEALAIFSLFVRMGKPSAEANHLIANRADAAQPPILQCVPLHRRSLWINRLATPILGVYLLQSAPCLVWYRNALGRWLTDSLGVVGVAVAILSLALICLLLSTVITPIARTMVRLATAAVVRCLTLASK